MKQFVEALDIDSIDSFPDTFSNAISYCNEHVHSAVLVRIYHDYVERNMANRAINIILNHIPDAHILGGSFAGELCNVDAIVNMKFVISISVFEESNIDTYLYDCSNDDEKQQGKNMCADINKTDSVKAAEMIIAAPAGFGIYDFITEINKANPDVQIFGGGADRTLAEREKFVYTEKGMLSNGVAVAIFSGEALTVCSDYSLGWKQMGSPRTVTKACGNMIFELDNEPAFNIYNKYLNIQNDEHFKDNVAEFPLIKTINRIDIARVPLRCDENGHIELGASVTEGETYYLSYGDTRNIMECLIECYNRVKEYEPQGITMYSCTTRKILHNYFSEFRNTFSALSSVCGGYVHGEFLRVDGKIINNNATVVLACFREGTKKGIHYQSFDLEYSGKATIMQRMSNYVSVTTRELEEANEKLELLATTDGLTRLFNRGYIERLLEKEICSNGHFENKTSVIMLDIDYFKTINDNFGHSAGDSILRSVARIIDSELGALDHAGRWGGDEFFIIVNGDQKSRAHDIAEKLLNDIRTHNFEKHGVYSKVSLSIGCTDIIPGESLKDVYKRVDKALYLAKTGGRDKLVEL